MPLSGASATDLVTLSASQTVTSGTGAVSSAVPIYGIRMGMDLVLDVTAAATVAGDTLDVKVQALIMGSLTSGGQWTDVAHFTQIVGNGGAKREIFKILGSTAVAHYDATAALSAGTQKDTFGDYYRVNYTVVNSSAPSFTFSVFALPF
jgi:hypothetical protein